MEQPRTREELLHLAHQRLCPSITDHSYLVKRKRAAILRDWIESLPGDDLRVLDVGGRYQPYRPLLRDRVKQYIALDVQTSALVSVVGKGEQLPLKSDTFDLVLATGVFEYFPEPRIAAEQIYRVLKPGGHLLLSVAAVCPRAVDQEHWRYLPSGLRYILSPFSTVEIVPEVTSIGGFFRMTAWSFSVFSKYEFLRKIVHHTVVPALNLTGLALDQPSLTSSDVITGNYCARAKK